MSRFVLLENEPGWTLVHKDDHEKDILQPVGETVKKVTINKRRCQFEGARHQWDFGSEERDVGERTSVSCNHGGGA